MKGQYIRTKKHYSCLHTPEVIAKRVATRKRNGTYAVSEVTKTKISKGGIGKHIGSLNGSWKEDDELNYTNGHKRINKKWGKPQLCEMCETTTSIRYLWHNISGKYIYSDRKDWLRLCQSCHSKFHQVHKNFESKKYE